MTALTTLARELRARIGLDADTLGPRALAHAVRTRASARGLDDAAYLAAVAGDAAEWQALVETLLVPETWFFRDRGPFALLTRWATREWAGRTASDPVAVLSLPCSTGEEAWSIAIALAAAGLDPTAFRIDAADLSDRALAVARAGRYRPRALRGGSLDPAWSRYLETGADGHIEVAAELRPSVTFQRANLVDAPRLFAGRRFDCVFCRNLLIYCDDAARRAAVAGFTTLLRPNGLLVLGHAETLPLDTSDFVREGPANAFAWRRAVAPTLASRNAPPGGAGPRARAPRPSRPIPGPGSPARPATTAPSPPADLARARALADRGRLDDAAAIATARVDADPTDADAHALLGIVRAAQQRDHDAIAHLRRALYLAPEHEEALGHLAVLLEHHGDDAGAARLRARLRRLEVTP